MARPATPRHGVGRWPGPLGPIGPDRPPHSQCRGRNHVKTTDLKIDLLRSVPGFADLSERELARYAPLFDEVKVAAGMVLTREGEVGRELVVIVSLDRKSTRLNSSHQIISYA